MAIQISLQEIEQAVQRILTQLREQQGETIELPTIDYYWALDQQEIYDPHRDPSQFTLGQLSDDLAELQQIAQGKSDPVSQDLIKLSAVLAALGHTTVW